MTTVIDPVVTLEKLTCIYQQIQVLFSTTTSSTRHPAFQDEMNKADAIYKQIMLKSLNCTGPQPTNSGESLEQLVCNLDRYHRAIALVEERIVVLTSIHPPVALSAQWWNQFSEYSTEKA